MRAGQAKRSEEGEKGGRDNPTLRENDKRGQFISFHFRDRAMLVEKAATKRQ